MTWESSGPGRRDRGSGSRRGGNAGSGKDYAGGLPGILPGLGERKGIFLFHMGIREEQVAFESVEFIGPTQILVGT